MENKRILFVDDDTFLGDIVKSALESAGYQVHFQSSLTAITAILQEFDPHVIVLDIEIGQKDGIDFLPKIKSVKPSVPVIYVSSHKDSSEVVRAVNAGGSIFLSKPFEIEVLIAYIERFSSPCKATEIMIGEFTVDVINQQLYHGNEDPKHISVFESKLLYLLAQHQGETVSRKEIEQELWPNKTSNEQSLNNYIFRIRKLLKEDPHVQILVVPMKGYQLCVKK